ncbi:MAG TPA: translation elongation factor Ts [Lachnospiraceae bacterium]|nr:translation elongation factor Ts [Lachnospiraceae bacterium]
MAAITAAMVKALREKSGAGMMDCKKALTATEGDMDKAIDFLRENGQMKAAKKADRIAAEGLCVSVVSDDEKRGVAVEVNSETDFVAKNEKFQNYVRQVADQVMATETENLDEFLSDNWKLDETKTVKDVLTEQISVIGENMKIRRFARIQEENGFIASYTHMGGKIVVLVDVATDVVNDKVREMAKNVAMQAAAMRPEYCTRDEVDQDYLAKEKDILLTAAKNEKPDAPDKVLSGIVMGRLNKELSEICLLDQVYVKAEDGKQSVGKYVEQVAKENAAKIQIKKFVRFETGEGIEKKQEDFAAEVAAQRH